MISVVLPARNAAATLGIALQSLETQTLKARRVVVIDDGSTDSTPELLATYAARWPAIGVVRTPGVGIARALNIGLDRALSHDDTRFIARMDADDRCHPERLARQRELAVTRGAALVGSEVTHWRGEGFEGMRRHVDWANALHSHEALEQALWIDSPLPHPTWLVARRAFELVGRYNETERLPEDYEWLHRFFARARADASLRAEKVAAPLLDWAESGGRLTRRSECYREDAFNIVKARALAELLGGERELFVFGLGPKAKAALPRLRETVGAPRAIVDVHPRRQGITYQQTPVWDVPRWRVRVRESLAHGGRPFVVFCVGTPEARDNCEALCRETGLRAGEHFLAL